MQKTTVINILQYVGIKGLQSLPPVYFLCINALLADAPDVFLLYDTHIIFLSLCFPGDIQIGMMEKKGQLEVEVIRARGLVQKPGSKSLPGKNGTIL